MGAVQTEDSNAFLSENYDILRTENDLKILTERKAGGQYALLEKSFANKQDYDSHFKRTRQKEKGVRQSQNILKMVKLWSKEHNGVCSNLFKIYTVYEYPKVKLIDEIEARKIENKPFEESEILSILQSCINAFISESQYTNISPSLVFILPEGVLKVISIDLIDPHYQCVFNRDYYYSPEKIKNFQNAFPSKEENEKERVFSIGMTLLHSALLEDLGTCYEISTKRFNKKKLQHFKEKLVARYPEPICNILRSMLAFEPQKRIGLHELQSLVNQLSSQPLTINSFVQNDPQQHIQPITELSINTHGKHQKPSRQDSVNNFNSSSLTMSNFVNPIRKSEFQIIVDPLNRNSVANSIQQPKTVLQDKQNLFTDGHIMSMIKQGLNKIDKATKERSAMKEIKNSENKPSNPTPIASSQDLLSQYELYTNKKQSECGYTVQQYEDQSRYEGMLDKGMKNGFGKLIYPDGVFYQGNFKDDTLCGRGSLYYGPNRPAYIGQWEDNKFNGEGTLYNEYSTLIESPFDYSDFNKVGDQWIKFQGHFKEDIKEGRGRIVLTNGQTIEALFSAGVINGQGVFTDLNGRRIKGTWSGNRLQSITQ